MSSLTQFQYYRLAVAPTAIPFRPETIPCLNKQAK
jgi:hypothetical protein